MRTILWGAALGVAAVLGGGCSSGDDATTKGTDCTPATEATICSLNGKTCGRVYSRNGCGGFLYVASCGTCTLPKVCGVTGICGYASSNPSCAGAETCNDESCCTSINVPGGTFPQGRGEFVGASDYYSGGFYDEVPEFSSTVSSFALDKYEVTVGRFRMFVAAYLSNTASAPAVGAGANPNIPGSGWQSAWNTELPATQAAFRSQLLDCSATNGETWTDSPGPNENKPIVCVSWYESFAFCIWDGGRLPTESEWEYAAAGGSANRLYPWGGEDPDCTHANFFPSDTATVFCGPGGTGELAPVGSYAAGNGRWGHADLAGNVDEWTLDWRGTYPTSASTDYADVNVSDGPLRVSRGGFNVAYARHIRVAARGSNGPALHLVVTGLRCAGPPQ
jgi:formylglycine-generating enzyme